MGSKACTGLDPVLVYDSQGTEFHVFGIKVIGKRKRMKRLEPTVIGIPSLIAASNFVHGTSLPTQWGRMDELKSRKIRDY
jgi:hypothetical protein